MMTIRIINVMLDTMGYFEIKKLPNILAVCTQIFFTDFWSLKFEILSKLMK